MKTSIIIFYILLIFLISFKIITNKRVYISRLLGFKNSIRSRLICGEPFLNRTETSLVKTNKIYIGSKQKRYISNIFKHNIKSIPKAFNINKKICNKYVTQPNHDIGQKSHLNIFSNEDFVPITYYKNQNLTNINKDNIYLIKKVNVENGNGIELINGYNLPKKCPNNCIIQELIYPKLYKNKKYDLRVHCCICRNGSIYFSTNIIYRICAVDYNHKSLNKACQLTNNTYQKKYNKLLAFFSDDKPNEIDTEEYVRQLKILLPKIYRLYLNKFNHYIKGNLNNYYVICGMDFIPNKDNQLIYLEANTLSGWKRALGDNNYQKFYKDVERFIIGKPVKHGVIVKADLT